MLDSPDLDSVAEYFSNSWRIYQKILDHDYMEHRTVYSSLEQYLQKHQVPEPIAILELGCGDASFSSRTLSNLKIWSYTGVDLAPNALEEARKNLQILQCNLHLQAQELLSFLNSCQDKFDLILAVFAIHHLGVEQKKQFLTQVYQHLNPQGRLIWIDVFRIDQESREEYLSRYWQHLQNHFLSFSPDEIASIYQHISESDYPESEADLTQWGQAVGFKTINLIYRDTYGFQKGLVMYKGKTLETD